MPKEITKCVERLSLRPDVPNVSKQRKPDNRKFADYPPFSQIDSDEHIRWYKKEQWVYGFNLKNRYMSRLAKRYNLPWEKNPGAVMNTMHLIISYTSCVNIRVRYLHYRGRPTLIIFFAEDDGRKRLKRLTLPMEEIDEVRKAMYLPKGTKPRWYDCSGIKVDGDDGESSGDDDWPEADEMPEEYQDETEDECDDEMAGGSDSGSTSTAKEVVG